MAGLARFVVSKGVLCFGHGMGWDLYGRKCDVCWFDGLGISVFDFFLVVLGGEKRFGDEVSDARLLLIARGFVEILPYSKLPGFGFESSSLFCRSAIMRRSIDSYRGFRFCWWVFQMVIFLYLLRKISLKPVEAEKAVVVSSFLGSNLGEISEIDTFDALLNCRINDMDLGESIETESFDGQNEFS